LDRLVVIPRHVAYVPHNTGNFEFAGVLNAVDAEVLADGVLVFEEASNEGSLITAIGRVVAVSCSSMARPCTIFAPILSKNPGMTRAQLAPVSSLGPGSGRPAIRMPSPQLSPLMGA
jgi:hypothetical protein